jgi:hypothetical protein
MGRIKRCYVVTIDPMDLRRRTTMFALGPFVAGGTSIMCRFVPGGTRNRTPVDGGASRWSRHTLLSHPPLCPARFRWECSRAGVRGRPFRRFCRGIFRGNLAGLLVRGKKNWRGAARVLAGLGLSAGSCMVSW